MIPVTLNVRVVVSWELENSLPRFRPHGFVDLRKLLGFGVRHGCTEVLTSYLSKTGGSDRVRQGLLLKVSNR